MAEIQYQFDQMKGNRKIRRETKLPNEEWSDANLFETTESII